MTNVNLMIVGVGGQGSLLASKLLGHLLVREGYDVKVSEVHGMSQRGGSVVTYVRCGTQVCSPLVTEGEADFLVAFEALEGARWVPYLKPGGRLIVSTQQIDPMPVVVGAAAYPDTVLQQLRDRGLSVDALDALSLAERAGSARAANMVLMGRLAHHFHLPAERWLDAMAEVVKPKFLQMNRQAFLSGYHYPDQH
ncbi:MAG: indolepyruvate oxidoreductase subunit beta [Eubacteriales bacterium]